ncbi:MAG: HD domain-containing protein [Deltaproteobacteria bacterium]|jgi:tRNA nucleotidyltransferase (CCA-adding enzyme)|nr:HD domain-containing protein [Deltaproteobacteria bacterium]MBW2534134.1 HD domain-containing protein [Deltaproteobacteria bacterium]
MSAGPLSRRSLAAIVAEMDEGVLAICRRLRERGKRGWVVGGCVRDLLSGRTVSDWDVATDARPREVMGAFRRVVPTGLRHGTVTVLWHDEPYEVTTLRGEGAYSDGRRPDEVRFLDDIEQDLARRDLTINAMAIDPIGPALIDPFGGLDDLDQRVLRAVGEPLERFTEDGLRILRVARFAATLRCTVDAATREAMGDERALAVFRQVSAERVRDEWLKAMVASEPSIAFELMRETGILEVVAPELHAMVGCEQNRWHAYDVWQHTMRCLDACEPDPVLRMAALLHDVAKPQTRALSDKTEDYTFFGHEVAGARVADRLLRRLRFSNEQRSRIVHVIRHHLICYTPEWTDAAVRRWLRRVGSDRVEDLTRLAIADGRSKGLDETASIAAIAELKQRVQAIEQAGTALCRRDLAVDGTTVMQELSLEPGRVVGQVLAALLELVTEDPRKNERALLLAEARRWLEEQRS